MTVTARTDREIGGLTIEFDHVRQEFLHADKVVPALHDFNLRIDPSAFVSIVGPSGCGKTTALSMAGGLLEPGLGSVLIGGKPASARSRDVAVLFARDALLPWRAVRRNVELGLEVHGIRRGERRERAMAWLRRVRLEEFAESNVLHLSQGMRQRVAIARTLVQEPRVVLMDEPFAALDAQTRALQQEEFIQLWEDLRPTVVLVTHDLEEAVLLSDRVILMAARPGRIVADLPIDLPRPRSQEIRNTPEFRDYFDRLSTQLRHEVQRVEDARLD